MSGIAKSSAAFAAFKCRDQPLPQESMHRLRFRRGRSASGAYRPDRLVGYDDARHLLTQHRRRRIELPAHHGQRLPGIAFGKCLA